MPEIDTDLESLAEEREIASTTGNPLKDALANFGREEDTGSEQDDTEGQDDLEVEETEETEELSEESETPKEDAESTEEDEDEKAEQPKGKEPKLTALDIPMPNADGSKGPRGTGKIKLDGVPQEAADAVRHYIKQAEKLPLVEQQLTVAQEGAQVADFIEADPFSAMVMMSNARPDAAEEFVRNYIAMNPTVIAKVAEELELDTLTDREQKMLAKQTKRDAEDRAVKSYQEHNSKFSTQKQADRLILTVQELAATANVPEDEMEEFMFLASRRVAKAYQQNPRITNREVVASLQPIVAKYAKTPSPKPAAKTGKDAAKVFTAKVAKAQKFAVVGSGKSALKPSGATTKVPRGTSTAQAIRMLRAGKI